MALRMSKMSVPSPLAESMGMIPGLPPYGMFFNMTSSVTCKNPNQASVTMKAKGSKIELFLPNLTSYLVGGSGLPYQLMGDGNLVEDVHLASGGGTGEITQVIRVAFPLQDVLGMSATAAMLGYAPQFVKSSMSIETRTTLFGLSLGEEARKEEWCGFFGGSCIARSLDSNDNPLVPEQWEPAMCSMTKAICGKEDDMKAALSFKTLGGAIAATGPCPPETGLPNTTFCNVVTAPGVDAMTLKVKAIDPPRELTVQAQHEMDETIQEAETKLHTLLAAVIALSATFIVLCGALSLFCCLRRFRATHNVCEVDASKAAPHNPTILVTHRAGEELKEDQKANSIAANK
jgi:hypothetical protein